MKFYFYSADIANVIILLSDEFETRWTHLENIPVFPYLYFTFVLNIFSLAFLHIRLGYCFLFYKLHTYRIRLSSGKLTRYFDHRSRVSQINRFFFCHLHLSPTLFDFVTTFIYSPSFLYFFVCACLSFKFFRVIFRLILNHVTLCSSVFALSYYFIFLNFHFFRLNLQIQGPQFLRYFL